MCVKLLLLKINNLNERASRMSFYLACSKCWLNAALENWQRGNKARGDIYFDYGNDSDDAAWK